MSQFSLETARGVTEANPTAATELDTEDGRSVD